MANSRHVSVLYGPISVKVADDKIKSLYLAKPSLYSVTFPGGQTTAVRATAPSNRGGMYLEIVLMLLLLLYTNVYDYGLKSREISRTKLLKAHFTFFHGKSRCI